MDRSLLSSATSSDDAPPSGFQLNEIASKYLELFVIIKVMVL